LIKYRGMGWVMHVESRGVRRGVYRVAGKRLKERDHLKNPGVDGRIILRRLLRKWVVGAWSRSNMAQDKDRWREFVTAVMKFRVL
jgi:hypothetical protein